MKQGKDRDKDKSARPPVGGEASLDFNSPIGVSPSRLAPNVISLSDFRRQNPRPESKSPRSQKSSRATCVFYVNEAGRWLPLLKSLERLEVIDIRSTDALRSKMISQTPDLVLLESAFQWACPFETIDRLEYLLEVPIVLICDSDGKETRSELVKKAFQAGIHDTLFTPLKKEDLCETMEVLLKLRRHSLNQ